MNSWGARFQNQVRSEKGWLYYGAPYYLQAQAGNPSSAAVAMQRQAELGLPADRLIDLSIYGEKAEVRAVRIDTVMLVAAPLFRYQFAGQTVLL